MMNIYQNDAISRELIEKPPVQTQFQIFTLFGDYVLPRGGKIWTKDLLYLMEVLGMSERAVRSVLSRLSRNGWIASHREGRQSQYSLTPKGFALLEEGARRIFEPLFSNWDGKWQIVIYSLPEEKRSERHTLRTKLAWFGFGRLAPGTWISPHNRQQELELVFADLGVTAYVDQFYGAHLSKDSDKELVKRCWDLEQVDLNYQTFFDRFYSEYKQCQMDFSNGGMPDAKACFINRYWLMHEFQTLTLEDPNLPPALLPINWIGFKSRALFDNYRHLLDESSNRFVDDVMNQQI
jgi:phenylacetic acid degradation operon negative regulatory protein